MIKKKFEINKNDFFKIDKASLMENFSPNLIFLDPPYKIKEFEKIFEFIKSLSKYKNLIIILHIEKRETSIWRNLNITWKKFMVYQKYFF
ncbi:MAG: hypothetical protein ACJ0Q7_04955 [Pelagibacteraceae bacterium]